MNILILGGTGLLGTYAVNEAVSRKNKVTIVSRKKITGTYDEKLIRHIAYDFNDMNEAEFINILTGHDSLVYAMGMDDRNLIDYPAYEALYKDHFVRCLSIINLAKSNGVKKCVIYGSYFTFLKKHFPQYDLVNNHPYIKTRELQKQELLKLNGNNFDVYVFELPYIIGSLPGKIPPWSFLFSMLDTKLNFTFFFKKGGTAVATARQVSIATLNAIENSIPGNSYPIVGDNLSWEELAVFFLQVTGRKIKVYNLPEFLFKLYGLFDSFVNRLKNKQRGLNIYKLASLQYSNAFINPDDSMKTLGYPKEDVRQALAKMIKDWKTMTSSS
jgi:dihydroflavonol-4-reductase